MPCQTHLKYRNANVFGLSALARNALAATFGMGNFTNGYGCHHIFFWNDASKDKFRAICAGIQYTQIWDIKDPIHPGIGGFSVTVDGNQVGMFSGGIIILIGALAASGVLRERRPIKKAREEKERSEPGRSRSDVTRS